MHAVRAIITDQFGRTLLMQRADCMRGYWEIPGGQVDDGETAAEALIREVKEETGLIILPTEFIMQDKRFLRNGREMLTDIYHATMLSGQLAIDPNEHLAGDWFNDFPNDLTEIAALVLLGKVISL